jgi:protein XagA
MKKVSILFLLLLIFKHSFAGGGWPQPKKHGYFKFSQNFIRSPYYFSPSGDIIDITTISLYTTSLYGEYGITDRFTAILYFPFFVRNTLNEVQYNQSGKTEPGDSFNSVGDTDVSFKYGIIVNKPIVLSATLLLGLPLGKTSGGETQILQSGDGEFNQMIKIDVSSSFYPKPIYVSAYAGFNNRTRDYSDEVRFGAEIGFTFKKFIPILKINTVHSLFNGNAEAVQNGIFSNNTEYISPMVELNYQATEKIGISSSGGFALSGRNILASPNWSLGIYFKL